MNAGAPRAGGLPGRAPDLLVIAGLLLLAGAAYADVRHLGFLHYDDDVFVTANPWVRQGLTRASLRWAITADLAYDSPHADYWAPLTLLSRLLDVSLFGMSSAAHHLVNLALHATDVVLAFLALRALTRERWPSAFAAAVLAVHPLHVESVAWVTARKDVLSLLFWLAALAAYAGWARAPTRARWSLVLLAFTAGLLSKPSVITLPVVLLLLDRWPLRRAESWGTLVREKWPLFALSAASAATTVAANLHTGLVEGAALPLRFRMWNALDAYVAYLGDALWPARLAVGHAHSGATVSAGRIAFCAVVLAAVTALAIAQRRRWPYLLTGWGWFVVTLSPTIGLLQSGLQGRADRYMYIPLLGLSLAVGTLAASSARGHRLRERTAAAAGIAVVVALVPVTRAQVRYWRDDLTLFRRAAAVEPRSPIAATGLGAALAASGDLEGGERELRRALQLEPDSPGVLRNLAMLLVRRGRIDEAAGLVETALATWATPGSWARPDGLFTLALVRSRQGRSAEALELYAQVSALDPRNWAAAYNTGNLQAAAGRLAEAGASYARSLAGNADNVDALRNLGLVLALEGRGADAVTCFRAALEIDPSDGSLYTGLGRALAAAGRTTEALAALREGVRRAPGSGEAHFQLAEVLRAQGAAAEARRHYQEAARLDPADQRAAQALAR